MATPTVSQDALVELRHNLHRHAELSHQEKETAQLVKDFVCTYEPDKVIRGLGGHGLAFVFEGRASGPSVLFRAELDALPIPSSDELPYRSKHEGVSHRCGHDGHMTILAGLAPWLREHPPASGKVILLFQPAEETGEGALEVLADKKFNNIKPDYVFGLHNLPGYSRGQVVIREGTFCAASTGMVNKLIGTPAHAAEPEYARSPVLAMARIMEQLTHLHEVEQKNYKELILSTVIHARLGEIAFGTTPGYGEVMATLRAFRNEDMEQLKQCAEAIVEKAAWEANLKAEIAYTETFPATVNEAGCVDMVRRAAGHHDYALKELEQPFKWSDDFGQYTLRHKGAFFGLGSGKEQPQLHHEDFDFPDEILPVGIDVYRYIITKLLG